MVDTLPTQKITLSIEQHKLINSSLKLLIARHAGALRGFLPDVHSWHRTDMQASGVYREKRYDPRMASVFLSLRGKLGRCKRNIPLTSLEIAAAAFIFRATKEKRLLDRSTAFESANGTGSELRIAVEFSRLEDKLERARKRARNAAIKKISKPEYGDLAQAWDHFLQWLRYYLLYGLEYVGDFRLLRRPGTIMQIYKYQREEMLVLAERMISERSHRTVPPGRIRKIVNLALSELRRKRHPGFTVMTVIRDRRLGPDFLFDFFSDRVNLEPLKPRPKYPQEPHPNEKFRALFEGDQNISFRQAGDRPKLANLPFAALTEPSKSPISSSSSEAVSIITATPFTDEIVANQVATWLKESVPENFWEPVIQEARHQALCHPSNFANSIAAPTLEELVDLCRPREDIFDPWEDNPPALYMVDLYVDWVLGWLTALKSNAIDWPKFAARAEPILAVGYDRAKKTWQL
jgi:hypothetical protein